MTRARDLARGIIDTVTANTYKKSSTTLVAVGETSMTVSASSSEAWYTLTLPAGVTRNNFISMAPVTGVNNNLYITGFGFGDWTLGVNQIAVRCFLGNGVHLDPYAIRVFYRV
jgi:hypothetical protein